MGMNAERTPVIIGVGDLKHKQDTHLEPLALIERALRKAEADTGHELLSRLDSIDVIMQFGWNYRDLARRVVERVGAAPQRVANGPIGGDTPIRLLMDAAVRIANGESKLAAVCGAEAVRSLSKLAMGGQAIPWSDRDTSIGRFQPESIATPAAIQYGMFKPVDVYPLYEQACRAAWQQSAAQSQAESASIWADMSKAASQQDAAWIQTAQTAEDLLNINRQNRMVSYPYPKTMIANIMVNQGAAVIISSLAEARAMGIPEQQLIYLWGGAAANEPDDYLCRNNYSESPAMDAVLNRTLAITQLKTSDIDLFELYSCFPCVPKMSRRSLGLAEDQGMSVIGGLSFFGGPGNNYMTHAIAGMVKALRAGEGNKALLHGNGGYMTKHAAAVLATQPLPEGVALQHLDLQAEVDAQYPEPPELLTNYSGACTLETYSVSYNRKGKPNSGVVLARTAEGQRVIARLTAKDDKETLDFLVDETQEPLGQAGYSYIGSDGLNHWGLEDHTGKFSSQNAAVLYEELGEHLALVTINRPAQRNAVNAEVTQLLARYVEEIDANPNIRVAILTGAGDKAFCAGADLLELSSQGPDEALDMIGGRYGFAGFVNAYSRRTPWIAAVNGTALGGGCELALACDLVVASEQAKFGLPEVKRSIIAAAGGAYRLPRQLPPKLAMELILTGDSISAEQALEWHLVNRVAPADDVLSAAQALAEKIADNSPLAVQASRQIASQYLDETDRALSEASLNAMLKLSRTEDIAEGIQAFVTKRKPKWKGR